MIHYFVETYTLEGQWQNLSTTKAMSGEVIARQMFARYRSECF